MKYLKVLVVLFILLGLTSCEKQPAEYVVTYRVLEYKDGFKVTYKMSTDTLHQEVVEGVYTLANFWQKRFYAKPGNIVYISVLDTVINSFSRVQILVDGKIFKEKTRSEDRFMPVVVSGVLPD